jgi:hypothetical protein
LQQRRALDLFGAEKHARKMPWLAVEWQEKYFEIRHYISTFPTRKKLNN